MGWGLAPYAKEQLEQSYEEGASKMSAAHRNLHGPTFRRRPKVPKSP